MTPPSTRRSLRPASWPDGAALMVAIAVTALAAVIGSVATVEGVDSWYREIERPTWTPPDWLFGPVWTVLYLAMAIAAWMVWRAPASPARTRGLILYGVQLTMNATWSIVFFGMNRIGGALVVILLLLALIIAATFTYWRVDERAAWLFIPYVLWVAFATALNGAIWMLNRG